MNKQALTKAIRKIDGATGTAIDAANACATILLEAREPGEGTLAACERLVREAKATISEAKVKLKHEKNVWAYLRTSLLIAMEPDMPIEVAPGGKKDDPTAPGPALTPAKLCTSANARNAAAKQIRDALGAKAGNNQTGANGRKSEAERAVEKFCADKAFAKQMVAAFKRHGYSLTRERATVQKVA